MTTTEFKTRFLPVLRNKIKTKEYSEKSYSRRYGNISVHKDEFNPDVFNYIVIDDEVFHIAYPYGVELTKEGKNGMYGIIKGSWLKAVDLEYLKPFMEFQELEVPVQELGNTSVSWGKEHFSSDNSIPDSLWEIPAVSVQKENSVGELLQISQSIGDLLEYKNKKYGNSALAPLDIFKGKCKVGDTIDHKLARVKNSQVLSKNDVADTIGYLILVCKEMGWETFDEFKD